MKLLVSLTILFAAVNAGAATCDELLADFRAQADGSISFNSDGGSPRARAYPLDYTLKNLGMNIAEIASLGPKIVLLGEGYGTLFPALNKIPGLDVHAVDPIYGMNPIPQGHMGDLLRTFINLHQASGKLMTASADNIPLPDGSVDLVIAHMVLNNFSDFNTGEYLPLAWKSVIESLRLLKPGGRFVAVLMTNQDGVDELIELVAKDMGVPVSDISYESHTEREDLRFDDFGEYSLDKAGVVAKDIPVSRVTIFKK